MSPPPRSRTPLVIGMIVVLVALAAVLAVVLTGGDDGGDGEDTTDGAAATSGAAAAPGAAGGIDPFAATVEVVGEPLPLLTDPANDPAVGLVPPTLRGTDYDGRPVEIVPGAEGRPQLVVVLAHWCPHCNAEVPRLVEWRESGEIPAELDIVGISTAVSDERPNFPPGEWLAEVDWQWPVLADDTPSDAGVPSALEAYGVDGFPFFALLDAEGEVVARMSGEVPIDVLAGLVQEQA